MHRVPPLHLRSTFRPALTLAATLGCLAGVPATATAADVDAATFFADCSSAIFVTEDTTVVGKADITGSCQVSVEPGISFGLSKAKLTFTEGLAVHGRAASVLVDKSKVTAAGSTGLTLDSRGTVTVTSSRLVAETGSVNIPPGGDLTVSDSTVSAGGTLNVGGEGGLRTFTNAKVSAGGSINVAPDCTSLSGTPSAIQIEGGSFAAAGSISIAGCATQAITGTTIEALGTGTAVTIAGRTATARTITDTKVEAPAGQILVSGGGGASLAITDSQFTSEAASVSPAFEAAIVLGLTSLTATGSRFRAPLGYLYTAGSGEHVFEDCQFDTAGANSSGRGMHFTNGGAKTFTASSIRARGGSVQIDGFGAITITGTKVRSDAADASLRGIFVSGGGTSRTITDSQFRSELGSIEIVGTGDTGIAGTKVLVKNENGILLSSSGSATVQDSSLSTKLGSVQIPNGGSASIVGSKVTAGGTNGFVVETGGIGGNSLVDVSKVKGEQVVVRSFGTTTATGNSLSVEGTIEFSSTGTCTSTGNNPDVACF